MITGQLLKSQQACDSHMLHGDHCTCFIQTQRFPSNCLLTPLTSPADRKCKLID